MNAEVIEEDPGMSDKDEMEALFEQVADEQRRLERHYIDKAIAGGATDAAKLLDDTAVREQLGQMAFQRTLAKQAEDNIKSPPRPGPARRPKKHPTKRQRVKAARKANR